MFLFAVPSTFFALQSKMPNSLSSCGVNCRVLTRELSVIDVVIVPLRVQTISGAGKPSASHDTWVLRFIQDVITEGPSLISGLSEAKDNIKTIT